MPVDVKDGADKAVILSDDDRSSRPSIGGDESHESPAHLPVKKRDNKGDDKVGVADTRGDSSSNRKVGRSKRVSSRYEKRDDHGINAKRLGKLTISRSLSEDGDERIASMAAVRRARQKQQKQREQAQSVVRPKGQKLSRDVVVPETIIVADLANRMAERGADVVKALMGMGIMARINEPIDQDTAEIIVAEFGHKIKRVSDADVELGLGGKGADDDPASLRPRPPVVTIMGHVDHGKTSLLDALQDSDITKGEKGGITQHIGAYQVVCAGGEKITFLDTPGHEAFSKMRARGATVTDMAIIVIAANDGIKPQTIEAINHAQAAHVPVVIAVNKMDVEGANPEKIYDDLLQHHVVTEKRRGDVLACEISATKKQNLDHLQELILLQAGLMDLRASQTCSVTGTVIEARMDKGRGTVVTVLVQRGVLRKGAIFVAGRQWGRVRAMLDHRQVALHEAYPSQPVEILGCDGVPLAGDEFVVVSSELRAREVVRYRSQRKRHAVSNVHGPTMEERMEMYAREVQELPLIIKADTRGSVEAIEAILHPLMEEMGCQLKIVHGGVGEISESDVDLAMTTGARVIGFNLRSNPMARRLAQKHGVDIMNHSIIYNIVEDIRHQYFDQREGSEKIKVLGKASVKKVFDIGKVGKVAGCLVVEGVVKLGTRVRLLRGEETLVETSIRQLKREKDDAREVKAGTECGIALETAEGLTEGDIIECYVIE
ncbi:MAG: translation initiation factor IF-2 [Alphaproteobacteria bacterium GM7ARS4]|nr:translation initiation factor IF-2 [Alphaproteobacteria bacterium GM7ARS4]